MNGSTLSTHHSWILFPANIQLQVTFCFLSKKKKFEIYVQIKVVLPMTIENPGRTGLHLQLVVKKPLHTLSFLIWLGSTKEEKRGPNGSWTWDRNQPTNNPIDGNTSSINMWLRGRITHANWLPRRWCHPEILSDSKEQPPYTNKTVTARNTIKLMPRYLSAPRSR